MAQRKPPEPLGLLNDPEDKTYPPWRSLDEAHHVEIAARAQALRAEAARGSTPSGIPSSITRPAHVSSTLQARARRGKGEL